MTKIIFLDAAGTLFDVRGSVGEVYGQIAQKFGVTVNSQELNAAFSQSFASASPMAFPGIEAAKIPQLEFEWWQAVAAKAFQIAGVFHQFSEFSKFLPLLCKSTTALPRMCRISATASKQIIAVLKPLD